MLIYSNNGSCFEATHAVNCGALGVSWLHGSHLRRPRLRIYIFDFDMVVSDRASKANKASFGPEMLSRLALSKKLPMYISDRALPPEEETIHAIEVCQRALCI